MKYFKKYHFRRQAHDLRSGDWIKVGGQLYEIQDIIYSRRPQEVEIRCLIRGIPGESFTLSVPPSMPFTIYFKNLNYDDYYKGLKRS